MFTVLDELIIVVFRARLFACLLILELTAVLNDNLGAGCTRPAADPLNGADNVHSLSHGTKDDVLAVEPDRRDKGHMLVRLKASRNNNARLDTKPTYQVVSAVQRKNWDPLVLGPALAMDKIPDPVCLSCWEGET